MINDKILFNTNMPMFSYKHVAAPDFHDKVIKHRSSTFEAKDPFKVSKHDVSISLSHTETLT